MTAADRPVFARALGELFAAFGKALDEAQVAGYWKFLGDRPLGDVLDGIDAAGRGSGRYCPSVGQIREAIDVLSGPRRSGSGRVACEDCQGTGWAIDVRQIAPGETFSVYAPKDYAWHLSRAVPCSCPNGDRRGHKAHAGEAA